MLISIVFNTSMRRASKGETSVARQNAIRADAPVAKQTDPPRSLDVDDDDRGSYRIRSRGINDVLTL